MAKRNPDQEPMTDEPNQAEIDAESTRRLREARDERVKNGTDKSGKGGRK
jgi:hypothetical protein